MIRFVSAVASASVFLSIAGCADLLSTNPAVDVRVSADLGPDNAVTYTVQNDGPEAIILDLSPAVQILQYREDGEWRWPDPQPTILPLIVKRIEVGDVYVSEAWDTSGWEPREYRFNLWLTEDVEDWPSLSDYPEGVDVLPEEVRVSNSLRIE